MKDFKILPEYQEAIQARDWQMCDHISDEYVTELATLRKSHKELEKKLGEALDELAKIRRQYEGKQISGI